MNSGYSSTGGQLGPSDAMQTPTLESVIPQLMQLAERSNGQVITASLISDRLSLDPPPPNSPMPSTVGAKLERATPSSIIPALHDLLFDLRRNMSAIEEHHQAILRKMGQR